MILEPFPQKGNNVIMEAVKVCFITIILQAVAITMPLGLDFIMEMRQSLTNKTTLVPPSRYQTMDVESITTPSTQQILTS